MNGGIFGVAIALFFVLLFFLSLGSVAQRPGRRDPQTGELILQCSPLLSWTMAVITLGMPLLLGMLIFLVPFERPEQVFIPIGMSLFFVLLGGGFWFWSSRRRTRIGPSGLTSEYALFRPQFLPWHQVTKVDFANGQEFWVRAKDGRKAMLWIFFVGVAEAVPLLRAHLPQEVLTQYGEVLERFACCVGNTKELASPEIPAAIVLSSFRYSACYPHLAWVRSTHPKWSCVWTENRWRRSWQRSARF